MYLFFTKPTHIAPLCATIVLIALIFIPVLSSGESAVLSSAYFKTLRHVFPVVIDNTAARRDETGQILDAHDGSLQYFNHRFYLYGTEYGASDGLGKTNTYVCYSSSDLINWRYENALLPGAPQRIYYRPYVKFNRHSGLYVLWYNADNQYGVAVSKTPQGPFRIVNPNVYLKFSDRGVGDFGLFVGSNGVAYIAYVALDLGGLENHPTTNPLHHRISIERLSPDFLSSTLENSGFVAGNVESPALFERQGLYYLLFDNTCAFCSNGSGVRVYTAHNPLGPFSFRNNINLLPASQGQGESWTLAGTGRNDVTVHAQQTHIAELPTLHGTTYMWMGDRWGSTPDKVKGHDFQVWLPLSFKGQGILPLTKSQRWQLELKTSK